MLRFQGKRGGHYADRDGYFLAATQHELRLRGGVELLELTGGASPWPITELFSPIAAKGPAERQVADAKAVCRPVRRPP